MANNFKITRGNANLLNLTVTDSANLPVIKSGDTIYFTAKPAYDEDKTDASAVIKEDFLASSVLDVETGRVSFILDSSTTNVKPGRYVYDLVLKQEDGDRITLLSGKLTIKPAATLRGYDD